MFVANEYTGADGEILRYGELLNSRQPSSNRALLFIPGLGGSIKSALEFLEALLPVHSPIYGPDLRGFGLNPLQDPLHQADIILKDLDAFYRQVVEPVQLRDITLCGLSLGGVFA